MARPRKVVAHYRRRPWTEEDSACSFDCPHHFWSILYHQLTMLGCELIRDRNGLRHILCQNANPAILKCAPYELAALQSTNLFPNLVLCRRQHLFGRRHEPDALITASVLRLRK